MKPLVGKVPGFSYEVCPASEPLCSICERDGLSVLLVNAQIGVCEPCSMLLAWVWRDFQGLTIPTAAYPLEIGFVLILIVRVKPEYAHAPEDPDALEVLMVERKDEPGAFGLPGGKVERDETPKEAAVRELIEETSVRTWTTALESIHTAYSPRARLGQVFLCRGYDGEPEDGSSPEGVQMAWLPWPPSLHAQHLAGFYAGVEEAFDAKWKMHRTVSATTPLSLRLGEPAVLYLERRMKILRGERKADDGRMLEIYMTAMSDDEKGICQVILSAEKKLVPPPTALVAPAAVETVGEEAEEADEGGDDEDENAVSGEQSELGFVRPAPAVRRGP